MTMDASCTICGHAMAEHSGDDDGKQGLCCVVVWDGRADGAPFRRPCKCPGAVTFTITVGEPPVIDGKRLADAVFRRPKK